MTNEIYKHKPLPYEYECDPSTNDDVWIYADRIDTDMVFLQYEYVNVPIVHWLLFTFSEIVSAIKHLINCVICFAAKLLSTMWTNQCLIGMHFLMRLQIA